MRGRPIEPVRALQSIDVALVGLHGEYGEDGEVQKLLARAGVPYTGSDAFSSYLAMHKLLSKERAKEMGLKTPDYQYLEEGGDPEAVARSVVQSFLQPVVIKPVRWGSSVGVSIVGGHAPVLAALTRLSREGTGGILIEERIRGREATVGVVENLRGEELYVLPPVEIIPPKEAGFFASHVKYTGETQEICPARFSQVETEDLMNAARTMHRALGLRHYSRSDFIVSPRGVYYLETNTLPGMTEESLLPKSLAAVGVSFRDFLTHLIDLALKRT